LQLPQRKIRLRSQLSAQRLFDLSGHPRPGTVTRLQHSFHTPEAQLLLANLARILKTNPKSLGHLSHLRELHLRDNRLKSLPEAIGSMRELRQIDLRGNPLVELPPALVELPRLEKLDVRWVATLSPPAWFADLEQRGCLVYR